MPKEKLWFTEDMHHLRCWACAFLSRLSGITQGSQLQRLKSQTNAAGSTLVTNEGNFHATNWHGKTFVPPQLLGKNYRSSGNPEARKSAFIDWMLTTRKWEFPGISGLIFFFFFSSSIYMAILTYSELIRSLWKCHLTQSNQLCLLQKNINTKWIHLFLCAFLLPFCLFIPASMGLQAPIEF